MLPSPLAYFNQKHGCAIYIWRKKQKQKQQQHQQRQTSREMKGRDKEMDEKFGRFGKRTELTYKAKSMTVMLVVMMMMIVEKIAWAPTIIRE